MAKFFSTPTVIKIIMRIKVCVFIRWWSWLEEWNNNVFEFHAFKKKLIPTSKWMATVYHTITILRSSVPYVQVLNFVAKLKIIPFPFSSPQPSQIVHRVNYLKHSNFHTRKYTYLHPSKMHQFPWGNDINIFSASPNIIS